MHLSDQLHVIRMSDSGIISQAISNQFDVTVDYVNKILQSRNVCERIPINSMKRINLSIADKIRVIHYMEKNKCNASQVARLFSIHRETVSNIWKQRTQLVAKEKSITCNSVKRPLNAKYPQIDSRVLDFFQYARSQRLPVTSSQIQECAPKAADNLSISDFPASNGWLWRFLRRWSIQVSLKLHGKRSALPAPGTDERMAEIWDFCLPTNLVTSTIWMNLVFSTEWVLDARISLPLNAEHLLVALTCRSTNSKSALLCALMHMAVTCFLCTISANPKILCA